jgi:SAM-dependent methyltransferase
MFNLDKVSGGVNSDLEDWMDFNLTGAFTTPGGLDLMAPLPSVELIGWVSGLTQQHHFAKSGCDIFRALSLSSPKPLNQFTAVLDFGIGVGRLARLFKGFKGTYTGVDVDKRHIDWVQSALSSYVHAHTIKPRDYLPFNGSTFDCIISVSVFTHMNEADQMFYIKELARVAQPGATLMLTTHGERALARAEQEEEILGLMNVSRESINQTRALFATQGYNFIQQYDHFTPVEKPKSFFKRLLSGFKDSSYHYGITFISEEYIRRVWNQYFDVVRIDTAAIHDFQDIVVLKAR